MFQNTGPTLLMYYVLCIMYYVHVYVGITQDDIQSFSVVGDGREKMAAIMFEIIRRILEGPLHPERG
jgi:hypothetical protein